MNIIEYTVVYNHSLRDMIKLVNRLIKDGWQPFGGVSTRMQTPTVSTYFQTMVKYEGK